MPTTPAPAPTGHDDHDHAHGNELQTFILATAGLWSIAYAALVFVVLTGWFIPNIRADIPTAVISTARILGMVGAATVIHVGFQIALIVHRPDRDAPLWKRAYDNVTSFIPLSFGLILGHVVAATQYTRPYTAWWLEVRLWVDVIVILGLLVDVGPILWIMIKGRKAAHH